MQARRREFWVGFTKGYKKAGSNVFPGPAGLIGARLRVKGPTLPQTLQEPANLWVPRHFLESGDPPEVKGPLLTLARLNRRAPGLGQTLAMIDLINPVGRDSPGELRLLALAEIYSMIVSGSLESIEMHGFATDLALDLGVNDAPDAWSARITMTLPRLVAGRGFSGNPDNIEVLGRYIGSKIALTLSSYAPVKLRFDVARDGWAHKPDDICNLLASRGRWAGTAVPLDWKMMVPKKMAALVWEKSQVEIAKEFNISDTAVRAFCKSNGVALPSAGFWRMTPERRAMVRKIGHPSG